MSNYRPQRTARVDSLSPVWRALADPTRRRILDLLRKRPRTTGELSQEFPSSRFAVMKHLEILVRAGLVVSRRRGRERWNHLNAVPLQQVHERWVRPYEAQWAGKLIRLKSSLEHESGEATVPTVAEERGFNVVRVELEIPVEAPRERVWNALVTETARWWRKDFYTCKDPKGFVIEARLGGRMYEDAGNGAGLLWGTVIGIDPGNWIELTGFLSPIFGGPANSWLRLALGDRDGTTMLQFSEATYGSVLPTLSAELGAGWSLLLREGLKPYVESGFAA